MTEIEIAMLALAVAITALVISLVNAKNLIKWRNIYRSAIVDKKLPPDDDLVEQWKKTMAALPEHSPKWKAYQNRLKSIGAIK